jgi:hypothetical protein
MVFDELVWYLVASAAWLAQRLGRCVCTGCCYRGTEVVKALQKLLKTVRQVHKYVLLHICHAAVAAVCECMQRRSVGQVVAPVKSNTAHKVLKCI